MPTFVLGGTPCSSLSDQCDIIPQTITVAGNLMERPVVKLARREYKCGYSGDLVGDIAGRGTPELVKVAGVAPTEFQELGSGSQSQLYYLTSIVLDSCANSSCVFPEEFLAINLYAPFIFIHILPVQFIVQLEIFILWLPKIASEPSLAPILSTNRHFLPALGDLFMDKLFSSRLLFTSFVFFRTLFGR